MIYLSRIFGLLLLFLINSFSVLAQQPKLMFPTGNNGAINSSAFSADSKYVITSSNDEAAHIWEVSSGREVHILKGHTGSVTSASFSSNSKMAVTSSYDKTARIWDVATGQETYLLKGHTDKVTYAHFSKNDKFVLTVSEDKTIRIYEVSTGKEIHVFKGHQGGIKSAQFSSDNKYLLSSSEDSTARVWEVSTGREIFILKGHTNIVYSAEFSDDLKFIVTSSLDKTARIWDMSSGREVHILKGHTLSVISASFSPDSRQVVTSSGDSTARIWDVSTGREMHILKGHTWSVNNAFFSPDGKNILTCCGFDKTARIWNASTGQEIYVLKGHGFSLKMEASFSTDGKYALTSSWDGTARIWSVFTGKELRVLKGQINNIVTIARHPNNKYILTASENYCAIIDLYSGRQKQLFYHTNRLASAYFSPNGRYVLACSWNNTARIWDAASGNQLYNLKGDTSKFSAFYPSFSRDCKYLVYSNSGNIAKLIEFSTGNIIFELKGHTKKINSVLFSPDGKHIVTASDDSSARIWETATGRQEYVLRGHENKILSARFSPDGKYIVTSSYDKTTRLWEAFSGSQIQILRRDTSYGFITYSADIRFSADGRYVVTNTIDNPIQVWDLLLKKEVYALNENSEWLTRNSISISPDSKYILTCSVDNVLTLRELATGKIIKALNGNKYPVEECMFSSDGKYIITLTFDNTINIWDLQTGKIIYNLLQFPGKDWLAYDEDYHYDGSFLARNYLYFTCNLEIIELNSLKEQLWVPNLVERKMNGEPINEPKLIDLAICNLTPIIENSVLETGDYQYLITPQRGGLGDVLVSINGIEVKRYHPRELLKRRDAFVLKIPAALVRGFFKTGELNKIQVKAYISNNTISCRGSEIEVEPKSPTVSNPNVYAVFIGVSEYKDSTLRLRYAAKDAEDLGSVFSLAARKLLNANGEEHVFVYRLTTGKSRTGFPDKNTIRQTISEIGKKAGPNDILLVFFAGHGIMRGEKKKFYFLTSEATKTAINDVIETVSISTAELTEWIKPDNIKAQKRVLIFDACNSGQAIRDFVKMGVEGQNYMTARNEDMGQQVKIVEDLGERSGFFILSASASNQNAYELGKYSQGLLTYALLKSIKQSPNILASGKYLDMSKWFNEAKDLVLSLQRHETRQEPQVVSTNNFIIGLVDDEVRKNIRLSEDKPMFGRSDFRNTMTKIDNLQLRKLVDKELKSTSFRGEDGSIIFNEFYEGDDVYSLMGDYIIDNNMVVVSVILIKGGAIIIKEFKVEGKLEELQKICSEITQQAQRIILSK
jgi:WD40 repeat protein/uncharacterized caspase-like protein